MRRRTARDSERFRKVYSKSTTSDVEVDGWGGRRVSLRILFQLWRRLTLDSLELSWCTRLGYRGCTDKFEGALSDTRYLEKHGNQWRVQVKVPERLRSLVGRHRLVRGLHTDSLAKARLDRWPIVSEFKQLIAGAERQLAVVRGPASSPLISEAHEFHSALQAALRNPKESQVYEDGEVLMDGPSFIRSLINDRAIEIDRAHGSQDASTFFDLASGDATPISLHVDRWITEAAMKPRQQIDYRRAVVKFGRWLVANDRPPTVQYVTARTAGEYVSTALLAREGISRRTINKEISCLSAYWKWLGRKGHAELQPWKGQAVHEPAKPRSEVQRPFTSAEIAILFGGPAGARLRDGMTIAALSGLRIDEIARLEVRDISQGMFDIRRSKTRAGERKVPIHSQLAEIIERRCAGKAPRDLLFHELRPPKPGSAIEQSSPLSKEFTRYRRKLGVNDVPEGGRRSLVDFHSFRRWFVRMASSALDDGAAGYNLYTIADVVGHSKKGMDLGMTMGVYAGPSNDKAKQACVEAVRLPEGST